MHIYGYLRSCQLHLRITFYIISPITVRSSGAAGNSDYLSFVEDILTTGDAGDALFELFPDSSASSKKFGFSGIITNAEYGATLGEIQLINITFQTTGAITSDI